MSVRDKCELNYREYGSGDPLIILHGLLGAGDNWHSIARGLEDQFRVLTVDQRNHGASPWTEGMEYPSQAGDVLELMDSLSLQGSFLLGHSMGGKTAMECALSFPDRVRGLIIVDIAPIAYVPRHREMIEALLDLDVSMIKKRSEADDLLAGRIEERMLRLFLLKNLKRRDDGSFKWGINLPGIVADYESIWAGIDGGRRYEGPVLFIAGGNGGYLKPEDREPILDRFPLAEFITFEQAGHWVHVDKPERFIDTVRHFFHTPDQ